MYPPAKLIFAAMLGASIACGVFGIFYGFPPAAVLLVTGCAVLVGIFTNPQ